MTEFQELVKDAPRFASMEHGELVAYAYAMYASGAKIDAKNAKLRELACRMLGSIRRFEVCSDSYKVSYVYEQWMRKLGIEVPE